MLNSIDSTIKPDIDKNSIKKYTKEFVKRVDNDTMSELIDIAMEDHNESLPCVIISNDSTKIFDTNLSYKNVVIVQDYEDSCLCKTVSRINENYFMPSDKIPIYVNPKYEFLKFTQGHRNLYYQNDYRGIFRYKYSLMYEEEKEKINCCDYLYTPTNGLITASYERNTMDDNLFVNLGIFNDVRVYDYMKSKETPYCLDTCHKTKFIGNPSVIQNRYRVLSIPKDISKLFHRITANYKEALEYLTLDEKSGYYCYVHKDGVKIPVICKHQIMILQGVNVIDIANECYKDGICKYCKQDMIAYNQLDSAKLPPIASSLVISFSECFKEMFSSETVIFIVFNFISRRLKKLGISLYSNDECVGYTCLFILKLIALCKGNFKMIDVKIKSLINKISSNLAFLGKSEDDVKDMLNSPDVFGDIESVITILKSEAAKTEGKGRTDFDILAEDVLFNSFTDRTPKNDLQKLYLTDKWKLYELFKLFEKEYNKLYNTKFVKQDYTDKTKTELNTIKHMINSIGYKFFQQMYEYYCPVHVIHEFKGNSCIHCSLDKKGKNIEDVYNKYSSIINNIATEEPRTLNIKPVNKAQETEKMVSEIMAMIINDNYIRDVLHRHGIEYTDIAAMDNNFKTFNEMFMSEVSIILNLDYETLIKKVPNEQLNAFVKKVFKYILDNKLEKEDIIVNIVYVCFDHVDMSEFFYML